MYSVSHNNRFVIVRREGNFINFFCINLMTMTSYNINFTMLFPPAKQALSIVIEFNTIFLCNILWHPLNFFIVRAIKQFVGVKFSSQTNKFNNLLSSSFILKHSQYFTIKSWFNSRWMISWLVTSVKPFLNVGVYIFVKIFGNISYAIESVLVKSNFALFPYLVLNSCNKNHTSWIYANKECSYQDILVY